MRFLTACLFVMWTGTTLFAEAPEHDLRLTLPKMAYAIPGREVGVFYENVVLTEHPEHYRFVVECDIGQPYENRWIVAPTPEQVGDHPWTLKIFHGEKAVAENSMLVRVANPEFAIRRERRVLLVGDSLTHASIYPNDLYRRLSDSHQPLWKFLGTHHPANANPGVYHEGYGGWTWQRFLNHFDRMAAPDQKFPRSPFVYLENDEAKLDLPRYINESCDGKAPDFIVFFLGINDCFGANPTDPRLMDEQIDTVLANAEKLIAAFREVAPHAEIGICLTPPANKRDSGFEANYKGRYLRTGWHRIQHRLVERQLKQFSDRQAEHISIVPLELYLDTEKGYPVDNAVHPNANGYQQLAATLEAWIMCGVAAEK